jgi:hypothetical protein
VVDDIDAGFDAMLNIHSSKFTEGKELGTKLGKSILISKLKEI